MPSLRKVLSVVAVAVALATIVVTDSAWAL